ncbi:tagaturonate reductase [Jannaschia faecimaris]|uniref:Tagaturonate reductase n=1 Tax=Jannaschia faecimaris TaxID=1244108 RepID=A0A1H3JPL0_9RHOB|nr:D-mannonate oxidoreductase [Jannaschia faecimaris]SDY41204.1 tagaturonate reductase [Jannaschia faecimaris]
MRTPILQFGTSRFLQAHADLFVSEARAAGQDVGPISVVQTSGDPARAARLAALTSGYDVRIEGMEDRTPVQRVTRVNSVARTLSTETDWAEITRVFVEEARMVLSNTGDSGYDPCPADGTDAPVQDLSYPAKLTRLLASRHAAGGRPIQVMPMELIADNGTVLRDRVLELAEGDALRAWLMRDVTWVNSLVDRIVSQPLEPAGAVAEPYALWAIEDQPGLILPCDHPAVQVVSNLSEIETLKLFILNLAHTWMADQFRQDPEFTPALVRLFVARREATLRRLYETEVLPAFDAAGMGQVARAYVETTIGRFANPYLDHRLEDIAQNHAQKVERRIKAFLSWAEAQGDTAPKTSLSRIVTRTLKA